MQNIARQAFRLRAVVINEVLGDFDEHLPVVIARAFKAVYGKSKQNGLRSICAANGVADKITPGFRCAEDKGFAAGGVPRQQAEAQKNG